MTGGDLCPKCGGDSGVLESRRRADGHIWRRRQCKSCEHRWPTIEIPLERLRRVERAEKMLAKLVVMLAAPADEDEAGE